MGTDRYAYQSRLRRISPMPKLLLTGSALVLCLLCDSVTVGLVTLLGMWGLVTALGGLSPHIPSRVSGCGALTGRRCSGPGGCSARHWGRWEPCTSWR